MRREGAVSSLRGGGFVVRDGYLSTEQCAALLAEVERFRARAELPEIHREARGRSIRYSVIDGHQIREDLPDVWELYTGPVRDLASELAGEPLYPLQNKRAGVNVNIMAPGRSEYRWHYDRAPLTAIVYLNEVEGGETELYPGLRVLLSNPRWVRTQRFLDRTVALGPVRSLRSKMARVAPQAGRLVALAADRCWHSVRGVEGDHDRINVLLAYDRQGTTFADEAVLDDYLYTTQRNPKYRA